MSGFSKDFIAISTINENDDAAKSNDVWKKKERFVRLFCLFVSFSWNKQNQRFISFLFTRIFFTNSVVVWFVFFHPLDNWKTFPKKLYESWIDFFWVWLLFLLVWFWSQNDQNFFSKKTLISPKKTSIDQLDWCRFLLDSERKKNVQLKLNR